MYLSEIAKKYNLRFKILLKKNDGSNGDLYAVSIKNDQSIFKQTVHSKGQPKITDVLKFFTLHYIDNDEIGKRFAEWAGDDLMLELMESDELIKPKEKTDGVSTLISMLGFAYYPMYPVS